VTIHLNRAGVVGAQRQGLADLICLCGAPARLEILLALAETPSEVGTLAGVLAHDITQISHQLRPLRDAGLVKAARHGCRVMYSLDYGAVETEESGQAITLTVRALDGSTVRFTVPRGTTDSNPAAR